MIISKGELDSNILSYSSLMNKIYSLKSEINNLIDKLDEQQRHLIRQDIMIDNLVKKIDENSKDKVHLIENID